MDISFFHVLIVFALKVLIIFLFPFYVFECLTLLVPSVFPRPSVVCS